jgi:hypothetical protein
MDCIKSELVSESCRRDGTGRRFNTPEYWKEQLALYDDSGLTQRAFCEREGIGYHSFQYWLKKERLSGAPLDVKRGTGFREVIVGRNLSGSCGGGGWELRLSTGEVASGQGVDMLAELISLLRRR